MSSPAPSRQKPYLFVHSFPHSLSHHSETLCACPELTVETHEFSKY